MGFCKQLQCVAFGCFCTLVGVFLSYSVLPLFGESGEDVIYENVMCKTISIFNDDNEPIAILGGASKSDGDFGILSLMNEDKDRMLLLSSFGLIFSINEQDIVKLDVPENSGRLVLNSSEDNGITIIGEKDGEFAIGIFGSKGPGIGAGASLSVEGDKGQLALFGENEEILFGRGKITYGQ